MEENREASSLVADENELAAELEKKSSEFLRRIRINEFSHLGFLDKLKQKQQEQKKVEQDIARLKNRLGITQ